MNENGRNVSTVMVEKRLSQRVDGGMKSQQFTSPQREQIGFLRRTFSFQIGKTKELFKLDSETSAMIKLRYKDVSKHVIWRDCALPEEYNWSCLTLNSDHSKRAAIRYSHAGNHQATILRHKDASATGKDLAIVPFGSPKTFPRTKHQRQQLFCTIYPTQTLPSTSLVKNEEGKRASRTTLMDPRAKTNETIVDIEDDQTPILKRIINSVRRSESSDGNESIVNLTAPRIEDESGFCESDVTNRDDIEPDLQIWRL
ncbi:hypothetical protein WUBG_04410 [Wuchereria bancrofti]|uniref:Uncharacterized protein n=1 Tax=Wuchereria bancrofti TaxID=6293 RepID=J9EQA1_WUCBA|nr:hypothetical protein WUBG_04410 [Wuchereria bancrofti]